MWLSKSIDQTVHSDTARSGRVTISSPDNMETESTVNSRSTVTYSPYGYAAIPPVGEEVLIIPTGGSQAVVGTKSDMTSLQSGEVQLKSKGGATITLRNDGTVEINSLIIDRNGVIRP